jgi:ribosomal-protein-alanine N-acetyltransferase
MQHLGTQRLETPRLVLRRFTVEDAPAMYANWASDDDVTNFLTWPTHKDIGVSSHVLEDWVSHYAEPSDYHWAVTLRDFGDAPIGSIGVVGRDDRLESVEIGYCIGKKWWGQGVVAEALQAVIDFLFAKVGVNRIEAGHDPHNPNSGRVMQKCGMKYEGTLREAGKNNTGVCDLAVYAILRKEYV